MNHAACELPNYLFVANVGEEGWATSTACAISSSKARIKRAFASSFPWMARTRRASSRAGTGVKRYRVVLTGPGGHSYGNFGRPSAIHAAGRIIDLLSDMEVPAQPKTTFNIGRIEGGTAVNAIAEECSFEIDLFRRPRYSRSDRGEALRGGSYGTERENKARAASGVALKSELKLVGNRPAGQMKPDNPLVRAAAWALKANGYEPRFDFSSTDANLPINIGIPAITMGSGGREGNAHSLEEWYEPAGAWKGPQIVLLTILAFDNGLLFWSFNPKISVSPEGEIPEAWPSK